MDTPSPPGPRCGAQSKSSPCTTRSCGVPSNQPSPTSGPPTPPAPPNAPSGKPSPPVRSPPARPAPSWLSPAAWPPTPGPSPQTPTGRSPKGPRCWRGRLSPRPWTVPHHRPDLGAGGQGRLGPARTVLSAAGTDDPHHERVVRHTRHPGREAVLTDCEDGATAHLSLEVPLGLGRRLMTFATACADATTDHTKTHGLHDTRDHATRVNDALVDVLRDGLTRFTPATPTSSTSNRPTPSTPSPPAAPTAPRPASTSCCASTRPPSSVPTRTTVGNFPRTQPGSTVLDRCPSRRRGNWPPTPTPPGARSSPPPAPAR